MRRIVGLFAVIAGVAACAPVANELRPGQLDVRSDQLEVMFRAAIAQAKPFPEQKALCFGLETATGQPLTDAPDGVFRKLARELRLPHYPASQCGFSDRPYPHVLRTGVQAMLYTVRIERRSGATVFRATAIYGNLGANGQEFTLVRKGAAWTAEPTGLSVVS